MNASVCVKAVCVDGREGGREKGEAAEEEEEAATVTMKRLRDKSSVPEALWMAPGMQDTDGGW